MCMFKGQTAKLNKKRMWRVFGLLAQGKNAGRLTGTYRRRYVYKSGQGERFTTEKPLPWNNSGFAAYSARVNVKWAAVSGEVLLSGSAVLGGPFETSGARAERMEIVRLIVRPQSFASQRGRAVARKLKKLYPWTVVQYGKETL